MKVTLTEQELKNVVSRGIMETVDHVMTQRGAVAHFNEKSNAANYIKRLAQDTGWSIVGYTNDGNSHAFVLAPNTDNAAPVDKFIRRASIAFEEQATVEKYGENMVKIIYGDIAKNRDFQNSMQYAQDQLKGPYWKTPWNLGGEK